MKQPKLIISRILNPLTGSHEIIRSRFSPAEVTKFLQNFLKEYSKNSDIKLFKAKGGGILTFACKKYRSDWEEINIRTIERTVADYMSGVVA